jgi:integrase
VARDFFESVESRVATGETASRSVETYSQRWRNHLDPRIGRLPVQSVQAVHLAAVLRELREEGLSSWTLRGTLSSAAAIFNHAVARGWISGSPTRRLAKGERPRPRNRRQVRVLSAEETTRVIASARPSWRPLIAAASLTGARIAELLGLRWEDVDWEAGTLRIERQIGRHGEVARTKTANSVRTISLGAELRRVLRELQLSSGVRDGFIFATESGAPTEYGNARKALAKAISRAEVAFNPETHRVSFHSFRHSAASALIRNGVDPVRVARYLGDRVETVLSVYAQEWAVRGDDDLGDVLGAAVSVGGAS